MRSLKAKQRLSGSLYSEDGEEERIENKEDENIDDKLKMREKHREKQKF
jgi:hypothetical protein